MKVKFFNRLPVRLAGVILLMGFIAVPIVSELKRRAVERLVLQQAEVQAATATIAVVEGVQDVLRSVETTVRYLARDLEDRSLSPDDVDRIIRNAIAGSANFSDCSISFEPYAMGPQVERFGHYAYRSGTRLVMRDLAATDYRYWTRDWYSSAVGKGDLVWSEPFLDKGGSNTNVVRVSAPFYRTENGKRVLAGVVAAGFDLAWIKELIGENEFFDTGYVVIFSSEGRLIAHPNPAYIMSETMEGLAEKANAPELAAIYQKVLAKRQGSLSYLSPLLHKRVHENFKPAQIAGWGVVVGYAESEFLQQVSAFRWITTLELAVTLALLAVIVLAATGTALKPLNELTQASDEIGRGNLDCAIKPPRRDDEIGRLSRSMTVMRDVLKQNRELELKVKEHAANLAAANEKLSIENLERAWVNQALEHQLRYNQLIINSISDSVFVLTKALNISRINPAVIHLTGFEQEELINVPLSDSSASRRGRGAQFWLTPWPRPLKRGTTCVTSLQPSRSRAVGRLPSGLPSSRCATGTRL